MTTEPFDKDLGDKSESDKIRKFIEKIQQKKNSEITDNKEGEKTKKTSTKSDAKRKDKKHSSDILPQDVHSVEVQEILGYIPNWIIRWGITIIAGTIILLLLGSWFVKYPDVITASIDITSLNPPVYLKAQSSGKLKHLLVSDNEKVKQGQYLAVLGTTTDYEHVLLVKNQLEILRQKNVTDPAVDILPNLTFNNDILLGEQQADYENFLNSCREYFQFYEYNYYKIKLNSLRTQLKETEQKNNLLTNQQQTLQSEYDLTNRQYQRVEKLYENKLVSADEFERAHSELLQKQYSLDVMKITLTDASLQINKLGQDILEMEHDSLMKENSLRNDIKKTSDKLLSQIMFWEQKFVIKSPLDGFVSLGHYWSESQNVDMGDIIVTVIPDKVSNILGRIELPLKGSGKVRVGQSVNVKFLNYPHTEYGMVKGIIKAKSIIPEGDIYILNVFFPDNLKTNYGFTIPFGQKMKGDAEIITDDLSVLGRIFNSARSLITN